MSKTLDLLDKLTNAVHMARVQVLAFNGNPEEATPQEHAIAHQAALLLDHLEGLEADFSKFRENAAQ